MIVFLGGYVTEFLFIKSNWKTEQYLANILSIKNVSNTVQEDLRMEIWLKWFWKDALKL
uniref:Uncharacterized protein n=1 Tax=Meloidogyne enterolobii TaxID=390850 RepID=A0A6V7UBV5_MELEN|nr:unnamed protein product [Meloidogyne enterolobii]